MKWKKVEGRNITYCHGTCYKIFAHSFWGRIYGGMIKEKVELPCSRCTVLLQYCRKQGHVWNKKVWPDSLFICTILLNLRLCFGVKARGKQVDTNMKKVSVEANTAQRQHKYLIQDGKPKNA